MKALDRKMFRDLATLKGQAAAIAAVVACGIAVLVMAMTTLRSLSLAKDRYYADKHFADLFVSVVRAPLSLAERAARLDGVAAVDHRVVEFMTLDMPGMAEPASGRAVSLPEVAGTGLNQLYLQSGRWPEPDRPGEVIVGTAFAEAHALLPGAQLPATLRGRRQSLTVVGIAMSPEYLIQIQPGSFLPDDRRFGVFWMAREQLEAAADMEGAFNDLTLVLSRDAIPEEVIRKLDHLLAPYGSAGAYTRNEHYSARFIADELKGLRVMALLPPLIFLSVAAFLLNISLRRILALQREQVAALKAFGYTGFEVGMHYAKLVGIIVVIGSLAGCLLGTWMAGGMTEMYRSFYRFPVKAFQPGFDIYLTAVALSLAVGSLGVLGSVRATMKLPPAEAMRPAPPATYRPSLWERIGLQRLFSQPGRMVIREIGRRPFKALFTALGIALACAILIVGNFGKDSIDFLIDFQFSTSERDDARVQFVEARPARALHELRSIQGVMRAEPFRSVPVRLRHGPRFRQLAITGLAEDGGLVRLLDHEEQVIPLRGDGLVLSTVLAKVLDVAVGDQLHVEVLEGERAQRTLKVSGLVEDFAGTAAYMNLDSLNRFLAEGRVVSGAYLQLDGLHEQAVFHDLKNRPGVAGVILKKATIQSFLDSFAENLLKMRIINLIFASVIAVGVIYSSARISFSERARDLATLRVIGLTRGEVSAIMLGEMAVLTAVAIPFGLLIGFGLCKLMSAALATELYRIPFVLNPATYGIASLTILLASALSALIVRSKINHLDLITALKIRE